MRPALLLVDLQEDYLNSSGLRPAAEALVARAATLLDGCRRRRVPVLHVWTTIHRSHDRRLPHWKRTNRWLCVAGTKGHEPPASLQPLPDEILIHKSGFNAFADANLDAALRRMNCDTVILAGVHLHTCVRAAATESLERGFEVLIAEDAVGSNDPFHAAAVRRWLADRCVQFHPVTSVLSRLDGKAHSSLVHFSPSDTDNVLFEVAVAGSDEIAEATATAQGALAKWRRESPSFRRQLLERVAERLDAAARDLAQQLAIEIGKPLSHGMEEVRRAACNIRDVVRQAAAFELRSREAGGAVHHRSSGVVAIITPWNEPVAVPIGKIAPALVYGNTVVWKPAPAATRISQAILKFLHLAGVPADAVRLLTGDHTTAQRLAADERVDAVTFTGSSGGYAIQEICARRFVPLQAEWGGNNAAIVWDDADLPRAAAEVARAAFGFAGQSCTSNRRVVVSRTHHESFLRELKIAAEKLVWGDALAPATDVGPVIDSAKRDEHVALIRIGEASGAAHRVEYPFEGRAREPWVKIGAFAQPVIVCCDDPEHRLVQEETMSPLIVIQRADDFDHAVNLCNGVRHGLIAALYSRAPELQQKFLADARAPIIKLTSAMASVDASLPFSGWTSTGIGPPEHSEGDRLFYTRMQAVYGTVREDLSSCGPSCRE